MKTDFASDLLSWPDFAGAVVSSPSDLADFLPFTDGHELHERGQCGHGCPWCVGEACDLGGEG